MNVAARVLAGLLGAGLVGLMSLEAVRTVVLPRGASAWVANRHFAGLRKLFDLRVRLAKTYEARDRVMAMYAPLGLVTLPAVWLAGVVTGFAGVFWAVQDGSLRHAFVISGSSVTTLGFAPPHGSAGDLVAFVEAGVGLGLVALLISFLPSIYGSFQRRELQVAMLEVRAGDPPSALAMIRRHHLISLDRTTELFSTWEVWFADIEETHTSLAVLAFFRSPLPGRSWITAAGAVLDGAALMVSTVDGPPLPEAQLCLRAGYISLRRIADYFGIPYDADPAPDDPISIDRSEFDDLCEELRAAGVALRSDLDQAWVDFSGWRVNYDAVLVNLAGLIMAPYAPWSSDRSIRYRRAHRKPAWRRPTP